MQLLNIGPRDDPARDEGFILSASTIARKSDSQEAPELCATPEKAGEISSEPVSLRNNGGEISKGVADWYHTRLAGTANLPHALLGLFKACLSKDERTQLRLSDSTDLSNIDVELLKGQGLIVQENSNSKPRILADARRVIRASIQVRVDDPEKQTVTLALRQPYADQKAATSSGS